MGYELILLAAGQGKRMFSTKNKILLELMGKPVIIHCVEIFLADVFCQNIVLVAQEEELEVMQQIVQKYLPEQTKVKIVSGGKERQDSVYKGLNHIKDENHYVFVHDGARPFVTSAILRSVYQELEKNQAAIAGVPVKDTIKRVSDMKVEETVPRDVLWQIQTPQAFIGKELKQAHELAREKGFLGTDDASLIEKFGHRQVKVVMADYENIKLTTPEDLLIGEAILKRRIEQVERKKV